ncbi:MAG: hypothetical protein EZS28_025432 [Streblomastix strix]|uniref:Uncharacterized protein n=1 Tax=Streblomastix strix TaxID=222440 RepID=A0A5J4V9B4_9EUKA|nr:MAG: hypothetical protein EZS28_025432 [Streblomastix strix]
MSATYGKINPERDALYQWERDLNRREISYITLHLLGPANETCVTQVDSNMLSQMNLDDRMEACYELLPFLRKMMKNKYAGLVTGDECWLYLDNPADSIWIDVDEQTPERARKVIGSQKVMITVFWGADRIWHIHALPHGKSMTSVTFINDILTSLFGKIT